MAATRQAYSGDAQKTKVLFIYLKSDQLRYAGDGDLLSGWDDLYEMASTGHADPAVQEWSHTIEEVLIDVLTRDIAIVTARGKRNEVDEEGNKSQRGYTVTDVFQRQENGWIIINEHESKGDTIGPETEEGEVS